jgi:hypothetical protein
VKADAAPAALLIRAKSDFKDADRRTALGGANVPSGGKDVSALGQVAGAVEQDVRGAAGTTKPPFFEGDGNGHGCRTHEIAINDDFRTGRVGFNGQGEIANLRGGGTAAERDGGAD